MTDLRHEDVSWGAGAHVHCHGKGRKERCTLLAKPTVAVLKAWIREQRRKESCGRSTSGIVSVPLAYGARDQFDRVRLVGRQRTTQRQVGLPAVDLSAGPSFRHGLVPVEMNDFTIEDSARDRTSNGKSLGTIVSVVFP